MINPIKLIELQQAFIKDKKGTKCIFNIIEIIHNEKCIKCDNYNNCIISKIKDIKND